VTDDPFGEFDEPFREDGQRRPGTAEGGGPGVEVPRPEVPSTEVPSAEIPSTEAPSSNPEALSARAETVDPAFKALFWKLVLLYKLAVIALTLGVLLLVFDTYASYGTPLAAGGTVLLVYALYLTSRGKARLDAGEYDLEPSGVVEASEETEQSGASGEEP